MSARPPLVTQPDPASPLNAFTADIRRTRLSLLYTIGLAIVAFAMVLLPAVYIVLILLTGWGVLYHLAHNASILTAGSGGGLSRLILYFGPAATGAILIFFMLKPLWGRRVKPQPPLSLDPDREQLLFAFVERICQLVRAPMPCRIDLDCQVNASASLRRGFWSRDLVLTIGLPLAAGLDMRQFAGVLAHEFGHFTQGAGMRLTYVIRNINFWFARVVFERDEWDMQLERTASRVDLRVGIILHAARGCVWVTRRILWALMHAGHAISCFMLRQMEYDADSYEARVAGSDAFESTATRLQVLNVASQVAFEEVRQSWAGNRLPENLPLLVSHKAISLPGNVHQKLAQAAASTKTKWSDTHPCDADRTRAAHTLNEPGVFRLERPATELFTDFAATCKAVTRHQYEKNWKLEIAEQSLVSTDEMLRESAANSEADAAIRKFYGDVNISLVPLLIHGGLPPVLSRETALAQWREAREQGERLRHDAERASAECVRQQQRLGSFTVAHQLSAAGFRVSAKDFELPENATSVSEQEIAARFGKDEASQAVAAHTKKVDEFISALRTRVTLAFQLSSDLEGAAPDSISEAKSTAAVLVAVGGTLSSLHQIGTRLRAFTALAQNRGNHSRPADVDAQMSKVAAEMRKLLTEVQSQLGNLPYPFPHPRGQLTVVEYAHYEKLCQNEWESVYHESSSHLERLFALHYRLLGRRLADVEAAETRLGTKESVPTAAKSAQAAALTQ
jgi:Zn-dependent protease with chaperone function